MHFQGEKYCVFFSLRGAQPPLPPTMVAFYLDFRIFFLSLCPSLLLSLILWSYSLLFSHYIFIYIFPMHVIFVLIVDLSHYTYFYVPGFFFVFSSLCYIDLPFLILYSFLLLCLFLLLSGGAAAQSVERATPGEEVLGSIPAVAARSQLVGSVSV